jgi:hypothetical protein
MILEVLETGSVLKGPLLMLARVEAFFVLREITSLKVGSSVRLVQNQLAPGLWLHQVI